MAVVKHNHYHSLQYVCVETWSLLTLKANYNSDIIFTVDVVE